MATSPLMPIADPRPVRSHERPVRPDARDDRFVVGGRETTGAQPKPRDDARPKAQDDTRPEANAAAAAHTGSQSRRPDTHKATGDAKTSERDAKTSEKKGVADPGSTSPEKAQAGNGGTDTEKAKAGQPSGSAKAAQGGTGIPGAKAKSSDGAHNNPASPNAATPQTQVEAQLQALATATTQQTPQKAAKPSEDGAVQTTEDNSGGKRAGTLQAATTAAAKAAAPKGPNGSDATPMHAENADSDSDGDQTDGSKSKAQNAAAKLWASDSSGSSQAGNAAGAAAKTGANGQGAQAVSAHAGTAAHNQPVSNLHAHNPGAGTAPDGSHHAQGPDAAGASQNFHAQTRAALNGPTQAAAYTARGATTAQPAAQQIALQISRAADQNTDRMTVHLKPENLGKVTVELEVGPDHRLSAVISADRAHTLDLLQRDARHLERALNDTGLKADSGSLQFNLRGDGGSTGHGHNGSGSPGLERSIALPDLPAVATDHDLVASRTPLLVPDGRVNIQV